MMCKMLDVSTSGYYAWRGRPESVRTAANRQLIEEIRRVYSDSRGRYGSPRVHAALRAKGRQIGRNRVARLMHHHGISARQKRRSCRTTDSSHDFPLAPNLLGRRFTASAPDRVWLADITYIPTAEGWLYLAVVLDMFSRRVVGWAMDERITQEGIVTEIGSGGRNAAAVARPVASFGSRQSGKIQTVVATPRERRLR
jgi:putative transposase